MSGVSDASVTATATRWVETVSLLVLGFEQQRRQQATHACLCWPLCYLRKSHFYMNRKISFDPLCCLLQVRDGQTVIPRLCSREFGWKSVSHDWFMGCFHNGFVLVQLSTHVLVDRCFSNRAKLMTAMDFLRSIWNWRIFNSRAICLSLNSFIFLSYASSLSFSSSSLMNARRLAPFWT